MAAEGCPTSKWLLPGNKFEIMVRVTNDLLNYDVRRTKTSAFDDITM